MDGDVRLGSSVVEGKEEGEEDVVVAVVDVDATVFVSEYYTYRSIAEQKSRISKQHEL